jgi:hypothetical protein
MTKVNCSEKYAVSVSISARNFGERSSTARRLLFVVSLALQLSAGYGILVPRDFVITHNDVQQSVGLL